MTGKPHAYQRPRRSRFGQFARKANSVAHCPGQTAEASLPVRSRTTAGAYQLGWQTGDLRNRRPQLASTQGRVPPVAPRPQPARSGARSGVPPSSSWAFPPATVCKKRAARCRRADGTSLQLLVSKASLGAGPTFETHRNAPLCQPRTSPCPTAHDPETAISALLVYQAPATPADTFAGMPRIRIPLFGWPLGWGTAELAKVLARCGPSLAFTLAHRSRKTGKTGPRRSRLKAW